MLGVAGGGGRRGLLEHRNEEVVDGHVADELEEEEVLEALEADGAEGGEAEEELREAPALRGVALLAVVFQGGVHLVTEQAHFHHRLYVLGVCTCTGREKGKT